MEPRPPRPRTSHPFEPAASPTSGIGDRLYPTPGEPPYYGGDEAGVPGPPAAPLLHRRQRRQQGALRAIVATLIVVAVIAGLGWFFRDTVRGLISPPAPSATVVAPVVGEATPTAEPPQEEVANALATVTPTPVLRPVATVQREATAEPTRAMDVGEGDQANGEVTSDISAQTRPLLDLLPTQAQVPEGMTLTNEAERSKAEVIEQLGGTDEAAQHLDDWGWSGNAYRDFVADPDAANPASLSFLNVSVHRFADAESAANALVFFSDQVITGQGLEEVEAPAIGDSARLLTGAPNGSALTVLYAQQGPILYRIGGSSATADGDPTSGVLAVAKEIIAGQSGGG